MGITIQTYSATCQQAFVVDVLKSSEKTEICGKYSAKPRNQEETSYIFHPLMSIDFSLVVYVRLLIIALVSLVTGNCALMYLHKKTSCLGFVGIVTRLWQNSFAVRHHGISQAPDDLIQPPGYQLFLSSKMSPVPQKPGVATRVAAMLPVRQQPDPSYLWILVAATAFLCCTREHVQHLLLPDQEQLSKMTSRPQLVKLPLHRNDSL